MVRAVLRWEIAYGQAKEVFAAVEALNDACRNQGWAEWTAWAPFSGKENDIVLTCDYPDVATYIAERDARFAGAEFMKAWRRCAQHAVQGSISNELLEPVLDLG
jgi:hypothetical protein